MPKKFHQSLQDYLTRIKHPTQNIQISPNSFSTSKNWILRGCRHPKTLSFAIARNQNHGNDEGGKDNKGDAAATLSDVDRFLFENFRSLYINDDNSNNNKEINRGGDKDRNQPGEELNESPRYNTEPPLHFYGSHRFFVTPGSSGSLIEESRSSLTAPSEDMNSSSTSSITLNDSTTYTISTNYLKEVRLPDDCIAVLTYSPSLYNDFRQSMHVMMDENLQLNGRVDWDFMEELLLCYLNLNEKTSHKFILSAFVDLAVSLRKSSDKVPTRTSHSQIASRRRKTMKNTVT